MGFFDRFKSVATSGANRLSGNADFLEAVCAASALVAAADGSVDDGEVVQVIESVQNNPTLSAAYSAGQIEDEMLKQVKKTKTPSGRVGLARELSDVAGKDAALRQDVFLVAADVAYADGSVSAPEQAALDRIATALGVDGRKLLAA